MPVPAPRIDPRTYHDIVQQTRQLAQLYTAWRPPPPGADAGNALIGMFGRMVELLIERLNQVPEKNFLAFLDLIGTQVRPPRAARVPLTFQLVANSPYDAVVPARTQVAATAQAGEQGEVLFETERDLVVTRAQLQTLLVHQPAGDRYARYAPERPDTAATAMPVFVGDTPIEHSLYLAHDDFFSLPAPKTLTLTLTSPSAPDLAALAIAWEYWDGTTWQSLATTSGATENQWQVTIHTLPVPARQTLHGQAAAWLRARLTQPLTADTAVPPAVTGITARVEVTRQGVTPAQAFANSILVDLQKDFSPFGEQPRRNDAFYMALPADAAFPGASITVNVVLSNPFPVPLRPSNDLVLSWEVWDGATWQAMVVRESAAGVARLLTSGALTLTLPQAIAWRAVNGAAGYWLRARMTAGNYGTPITAQVATQSNTQGNVTAVNVTMVGGYGPPALAACTLDFTATRSGPLAACLTCNDLRYLDVVEWLHAGTPFPPFTPSGETHPALYLGFAQPFANRPMTLYAEVELPYPGEMAEAIRKVTPADRRPRVLWEYRNANGWQPLGAQDDTRAFAESNVIRFLGPTDFTAEPLFGQALYWLRARWEDGAFLIPPRLRRVLTNTTWALQATTLQHEILGSGTAEPGQVLRTTQAPVLAGQRLEVREIDLPAAQEQASIIVAEGEDAITVIRDEAGQPADIWVRWHAVTDFYGSGPRDRHYVIDYVGGAIRFGDGQYGLTPPAGRGNIRLAFYRTSSGARGNRPAGAITQLKTAIPYIAGVSNLQAATGGADAESLERVKERGPKALRHRGRAVTTQDIEDLAYEASPDIGRARALAPDYDPIALEWLPIFPLPLTQAGDITVEAHWEGEQQLDMALYGPGQGMPYARSVGSSPQTLAFTVAPQQFMAADVWRVVLINHAAEAVRSGRVRIVYPVGSLEATLDVPAQAAYTPISPLRQGGQVELVIVPHSTTARPTPSLALRTQIQEYLQARCSPTLSLQVTEPDWVEVTVSAEVVPVSFEAAEGLQAIVVAALERFLHPLHGGLDGRGWPFGRRPHVSDLYALLAALPGVHHVSAVDIVNRPSLADIDPTQTREAVEDDLSIPRLPPERRDRFLIYSGKHHIRIAASLDAC